MQGCLFYSAGQIQDMLGISRGKAYQLIRDLNQELKAMGYIVIAGKIPKQFFDEHMYGLSDQPDLQTEKVQSA